ncbi:MAG: proton-conducting transporter membrane subunit, partial [Crocinitomicaceae bacterium]|nr:proton-conducting transporter membrane subunit [Crocinitomicaceae bacterium]
MSLFIPKKKENALSILAYTSVGLQLLVSIFFTYQWASHGFHEINLKEFSVYQNGNYDFYLDFYFDKLTMVYLLLGSSLTFLITIYSRYYLHREEGYKRFFNTILFFFLGFIIIIFAGNLEPMFIGWEVLGISSFLLIAFYRERYLPVKNALKVFSVYRIGDVGIILAMWLSHHLWHENISFAKLHNAELVHAHIMQNSLVGLAIAFMFYISAAAKSAQLPFSSWLPRAMEGPTPSSAIFYGSLSVHIGAFLMLRTIHFWENQIIFKVFLILSGLLTAIIATFISRVQSSIKSQIAYASIAQIGLIFMEIALGWEVFALVHITGNAFIRTYQLLISPSVVSYKIREQFYHFKRKPATLEDSWPKRFEYAFYILNLKEWNLDNLMYTILWNPLKKIGRNWQLLNFKYVFYFIGFVILSGLIAIQFRDQMPALLRH